MRDSVLAFAEIHELSVSLTFFMSFVIRSSAPLSNGPSFPRAAFCCQHTHKSQPCFFYSSWSNWATAFLTSPLHAWAMPLPDITRKSIPASTFCVHSGFAYLESRFCCPSMWVFCNICVASFCILDHSNWWHCPWGSTSSPRHFCSPVQTLMGSCQEDSWTSQSCFSPSSCDSICLVNFFFSEF